MKAGAVDTHLAPQHPAPAQGFAQGLWGRGWGGQGWVAGLRGRGEVEDTLEEGD